VKLELRDCKKCKRKTLQVKRKVLVEDISREDVREGIAKLSALQTLGDDGMNTIDKVWEWVVAAGFADEYYDNADQFLSYLREQKLVRKVDRGLPIPKWEEVKGTAMEVDSDAWTKMVAIIAVIFDRAIKAGFTAVEEI